MKLKLNGIEVEGSKDDIKELLGLEEKPVRNVLNVLNVMSEIAEHSLKDAALTEIVSKPTHGKSKTGLNVEKDVPGRSNPYVKYLGCNLTVFLRDNRFKDVQDAIHAVKHLFNKGGGRMTKRHRKSVVAMYWMFNKESRPSKKRTGVTAYKSMHEGETRWRALLDDSLSGFIRARMREGWSNERIITDLRGRGVSPIQIKNSVTSTMSMLRKKIPERSHIIEDKPPFDWNKVFGMPLDEFVAYQMKDLGQTEDQIISLVRYRLGKLGRSLFEIDSMSAHDVKPVIQRCKENLLTLQ